MTAVTVAVCGCADGTQHGECLLGMGSAINILAYTDDKSFEALLTEIKSVIDYAESLNGADGVIGKFNAATYGERVELDETVYSILKTVKEDPALDGYNPLCAPLVDLWGFSPRFRTGGTAMPYDRAAASDGALPLPDQEYIEAFRSLTDLDGLVLNSDLSCIKNIPSVTVGGRTYEAQLDLGGCLKGYCADRISEIYEKYGVKYGSVSLGTSSIGLFLHKSGDWNLKLRHPDDTQATYFSVPLTSGYVSTSGDYEEFYVTDGVRYCHIIGKDGYPVRNARSVTVIGKSAMYCDMLSTALMTVPVEEIPSRVESFDGKIIYSYGQGESLRAVEVK